MIDIKHQRGAVDKINSRLDEFKAQGWTETDLFGVTDQGYEGLAYRLRPGCDIGQIWPWLCEILRPEIPGRARYWQTHSRQAPIAQLLATIGADACPREIYTRPIQ